VTPERSIPEAGAPAAGRTEGACQLFWALRSQEVGSLVHLALGSQRLAGSTCRCPSVAQGAPHPDNLLVRLHEQTSCRWTGM
jgi:hypothetical protein